mgnify:CR=1 FL=1
MKRATTTNRTRKAAPRTASRQKAQAAAWRSFVQRELWGVALVALGLVTAISLFTSAQGKLSEAWALFLRRIFGVGAYPVALLMIAVGVLITLSDTARARVLPHWKTVVGAESLFFCLLALIHALARGDGLALARAGRYGGYIGWTLSDFGTALIGRTLTIILFALLAFGSVLLATNTSWATVRWRVQWALSWVGVRLRAAIERTRTSISKPAELAPRRQPERVSPALQVVPEGPAEPVSAPNPKPRTPLSAPVKRSERKPARRDATPVPVGLPSLDLLVPDEVGTSDDADARERAYDLAAAVAPDGSKLRADIGWRAAGASLRSYAAAGVDIEIAYLAQEVRDTASRLSMA